MKAVTLVTSKLYFGVDAQQMRESTARVLSRLEHLPPDRPVIKLDAIVEDFRVSAAASRPMIDEMVRHGLLQRLGERSSEYGVTDKFRRYADARIVEPLPRSRAKMLLNHIADLAWHFNRTAIGNKYEIDALAVFGPYMSLEPELAEVTVARHRAPASACHASGGRPCDAGAGGSRADTRIDRKPEQLSAGGVLPGARRRAAPIQRDLQVQRLTLFDPQCARIEG